MVYSRGPQVDLQTGPVCQHDRGMGIGLGLALAAAIAYGAADFVGGTGSRRYPSWQVVLVGQLTGALLMLVVRRPGTGRSARG